MSGPKLSGAILMKVKTQKDCCQSGHSGPPLLDSLPVRSPFCPRGLKGPGDHEVSCRSHGKDFAKTTTSVIRPKRAIARTHEELPAVQGTYCHAADRVQFVKPQIQQPPGL